MNRDFIQHTAQVLEREFAWFYQVLDCRIKLHFGHDCEHRDVFDIPPPELDNDSDLLYNQFVQHYKLNFAERLVLVLSLVSVLRPHLLDVFFTKNATFDKEFSEFGGLNDNPGKVFVPTAETALFLLAGDDLEKQLFFSALFDAEHVFSLHNFITLSKQQSHQSYLSGVLTLSSEVLDLVTRGHTRKPVFSSEFPAKLLDTQMEWEDLVLDPYTMQQIDEIKAWIDYGDTLLDEYGLSRKIKPGYRSLFFGNSGTGKTLTASLLGKVTGRDVYRIDLSMVVSKYIGETEKNLEKVFKTS